MNQNKQSAKTRVMTYTKPKLGYDVEVFKKCFSALFRPVKDDTKTFVYVKQKDSKMVDRVIKRLAKANPGREFIRVDEKGVRLLAWEYQLVGFNNNDYDDYMLRAAIDNKTTREIYEMSKLTIEQRVRLWTLDYNSMFATFDIRSVLPQNISLKQIASEMGYQVWEFDEVDWDYDYELTEEQLFKMLSYNDHDTFVGNRVFEHFVVIGAYVQHVAFISRYLPGCDWMISRRDASLAEAAIINGGKIKIEKKRKFDFMLNGHNVLAEVPLEWRNEYYRYGKDLEKALVEWERLVATGMDKAAAHQATFGKVKLPVVDTVWLDDFFGLQPSAGGIHSTTTNHPDYKPVGSRVIRADNIEHFDIGGAYGATAKQKNVYGAAQSRYNLFMDDKFRYKNAAKTLKKNLDLPVSSIKAGLKAHYGIDLMSNDIDSLTAELAEGVAATKLGTNSPTGKADSPVSGLYNPIGMIEVRLILQCLFYDIMKKLIDAGCVAFSANTDGFFIDARGVDVKPFIDAWERKWGLELDYDHIDTYIAKDDNNRILIVDGKVEEAAGDDLCHQEFNPRKASKKPRIVDNVLLQKLVHPEMEIRDILQGFVDDNRVDLFMWTLKASTGHTGVINNKIAGKINRVLLTKDGDKVGNYSIFKDKIESFSYLAQDQPVAVINGDLPTTLPANLDLDAYESLITSVYEDRWS